MARGEWGYQGLWRGKWCCSYKKTTLIICFINIVIALYVLRSIYASIYVFSRNDLKGMQCYSLSILIIFFLFFFFFVVVIIDKYYVISNTSFFSFSNYVQL